MFVSIVWLLGVADDVEDGPDADEHAPQHGAQLGLEVEARDLTQQRVVTRHVRRKLKQSAIVPLYLYVQPSQLFGMSGG